MTGGVNHIYLLYPVLPGISCKARCLTLKAYLQTYKSNLEHSSEWCAIYGYNVQAE